MQVLTTNSRFITIISFYYYSQLRYRSRKYDSKYIACANCNNNIDSHNSRYNTFISVCKHNVCSLGDFISKKRSHYFDDMFRFNNTDAQDDRVARFI